MGHVPPPPLPPPPRRVGDEPFLPAWLRGDEKVPLALTFGVHVTKPTATVG